MKIVEAEPQLRAKLWSNVAFLRRRFARRASTSASRRRR
jgi:hypothetical protein